MEGYLTLFKYYKQLAEKAMEQLPDESTYFWSPGEESNSIAVIVQHLHGNMKSRWTDFLTSDGEKEWRNRDQEFELYVKDRTEIMQLWEEGWSCLFTALDSAKGAASDHLVYIRNKGHSVDEAIQRQLAHYAYHVGQLVFISRMISSTNWKSLSIPKGGSDTFNEETFGEGRRVEHFTDGLMENREEKNE